MVVDTSAVLALLFNEKHGPWVVDKLESYTGELLMSTVNLAETLIRVRDRQPRLGSQLEDLLLDMPVRFVPPSLLEAKVAADARIRYSINLGDCFAYALTKSEKSSLLTLDRDFKKTDVDWIMP